MAFGESYMSLPTQSSPASCLHNNLSLMRIKPYYTWRSRRYPPQSGSKYSHALMSEIETLQFLPLIKAKWQFLSASIWGRQSTTARRDCRLKIWNHTTSTASQNTGVSRKTAARKATRVSDSSVTPAELSGCWCALISFAQRHWWM